MLRKIILCDDEPAIHRQLTGYLEQLEHERQDEFQVMHFSSGEELLAHIPPDAQLLLLDIQMAGISGIEAARRLRQTRPELLIILVTNLIDRALEGYEIHAFAFLCKPLMYGDFCRCMTEAFSLLERRRRKTLVLNSDYGSEVVALDEILYAEVLHHVTSVIRRDGKKDYAVPLTELEKKTETEGFFRCHKSYLINFAHVREVHTADIIMSNGDAVPLSKHRRRAFLAAYSVYVGERL